MSLSDDLTTLTAWVATCGDGSHELTRADLAELCCVLGDCAERALRLEHALEATAAQISPRRDRAALDAAIASGRVVVLAAHRVTRLHDVSEPGWTA